MKSKEALARMHREANWCEWCDEERATECHHISARGMGGGKRDDDPGNLVMLCKPCHESFQLNRLPGTSIKDKQPTGDELRLRLFGIAGLREHRRRMRLPKGGENAA